MTGVAFKLDGYGIVTSQSVVPGTYVNSNSIIEVKFEDIKDPNPQISPPSENINNEENVENSEE